MDIYVCGGLPSWPTPEQEDASTLESILYKRHISKFYGSTDEISTAMRAYPGVQFRYIVLQHEETHSGISELNFEGDFTWPAQLAGREAASQVLAGSKVHNVRDHFAEWSTNKSVRKGHKHVGDFLRDRVAEARKQEE